MSEDYVNDMLYDVLIPGKDDLDSVPYEFSGFDDNNEQIRDYRGTIEVNVRSLEAFIWVAKRIQARGWIAQKYDCVNRLSIGTVFDTSPPVAIVIKSKYIADWMFRYVNGNRTAILDLVDAANDIIKQSNDGACISTIEATLSIERTWRKKHEKVV